jgi:hypothetical protein
MPDPSFFVIYHQAGQMPSQCLHRWNRKSAALLIRAKQRLLKHTPLLVQKIFNLIKYIPLYDVASQLLLSIALGFFLQYVNICGISEPCIRWVLRISLVRSIRNITVAFLCQGRLRRPQNCCSLMRRKGDPIKNAKKNHFTFQLKCSPICGWLRP